MNPEPLRAVIDASVAVKIFVPETYFEQAQAVFARFAFEAGSRLFVPDLFFAECANVFWKWVRRSGYPANTAREHLRDLAGLGLTVVAERLLAEDALRLALHHEVTAYDACYVGLAARLDLPLITADEKLVRKVEKDIRRVQWLGDVEAVR